MSSAMIASVGDLRTVTPEWEDLAQRTHASPFLHPGWVTAWWTAFGRGRLEIRTVRRAGDWRLIAVLPLRMQQGALGSPTNWHSPEFGLLSECDEAAHVLLTSLFNDRPRRVSLAFLGPAQAGLVRQVAAVHGYRVIHRTLQHSPYVSTEGGWEAYEGLLSTKLLKDVRRRQRQMSSRGTVSVEVTSGERLDELLEEGFRVEALAWKGAGGTAIQSHPETRRFYTDVARWAAERGWLRLAFLRLDGRALAFTYALEHEGVHYLLKSGYDPSYRELGPSKLMRHAMLTRAFREGLRSYEFLGSNDPWKVEWTTAARPRELVQGFRPSPFGVLDWSAFAFGRPLAKQVRDLAREGVRRAAQLAASRSRGAT